MTADVVRSGRGEYFSGRHATGTTSSARHRGVNAPVPRRRDEAVDNLLRILLPNETPLPNETRFQ